MKAANESLESQNLAAEIKLRAERKAGELLAGMEMHGSNQHGRKSHDVTSSLDDLGVSKMQSSRWATHRSFAAYVEERFGFKKSRAYQLIEAAEVEVSTTVDTFTTESQLREVAKAPEEDREAVVH